MKRKKKSQLRWKFEYRILISKRMNDFPVIGNLVMRTGLWDRQGANIASRYKEMYDVVGGAVSPFKSSVFGQRMPHFAVIL